jgi:hypothetical protein
VAVVASARDCFNDSDVNVSPPASEIAVIEERHVERLVQTESTHAVGDGCPLSSSVTRMRRAATAMETIPITIAAMNQFLRTRSSLTPT